MRININDKAILKKESNEAINTAAIKYTTQNKNFEIILPPVEMKLTIAFHFRFYMSIHTQLELKT